MGFFKEIKKGLNKSPEEATEELLEINGLKIENYNSEQLEKRNIENLKKIQKDFLGMGFQRRNLAMITLGVEEQAKIQFLSALVEQGWIQIRQNEIIIRKLQELSGK